MTRLLFALLVAAAVAPAPAAAQSATDRGKDKIARLFRPAAGKATESTVRVQRDGKDVALGTVVAANGLILTKGSEVAAKGQDVTARVGDLACKLADGTLYDATVAGYHKPTDLALLKIDATDLKPVLFAESTAAAAGNWVAAPGAGSEVVGVGVVSAGVRKLTRDETVIENANKGVMGITLDDPKDGSVGVLIAEVKADSAAARANLRPSDLIYELAGKAVASRLALVELLDTYRPGDTVTVRVKRGDEDLSLRVKLAGREEIDRGAFQNKMGGALSGRRTGFPAVIQHDAVVRPADCGGPLVDLDGRVLGINIARAGRVETWALPGDVVAAAMKELKADRQTISTK
jgi:serine protease Do